MMKRRIFILACVLLGIAVSASAQITIIDSGVHWDNAAGTTVTDAQLGNLNLTNASKLVVSVGVKGAAAGQLPLAATYNGAPMTLAVARSDSDGLGWTGIYYLDNPPATAGNLVMSVSSEYSLGVSAMVLSGTDSGVGAVISSQTLSTNLTTTAKGAVVLAAFSGSNNAATGVAGDLTSLMAPVVIGSGSYASGYAQVPAPGSVDITFTATTTSTRRATVAAEFAPKPPPAGTVLTIK